MDLDALTLLCNVSVCYLSNVLCRRAECKEEEQAAKGHEKESKSQEGQIEGKPEQQEEKSLLGKSGLVELEIGSFSWEALLFFNCIDPSEILHILA